MPTDATTTLELADRWLSGHTAELVGWRRALHAYPEVSNDEHRTTELILAVLHDLGFAPRRMSVGTGAICDIGPGPDYVALRADIDALPLPDDKAVPYASTRPGVCHACGHDAHTAMLLGVAAALSAVPPPSALPANGPATNGPAPNGPATNGPASNRSVRLIFQPAEEAMPGGAMAAVKDGALAGVNQIFALHCDPKLDAGLVGLRAGAITAAFHGIDITLSGPGGHTARPHLTADVVYALGKLITELPGLLSRRVDPRSALSLVWGAASAGNAANAIPTTGVLRGTLRMLDGDLWHGLESTVRELVYQIVAPTGARFDISYDRGLPAVTNDPGLVAVQTRAAMTALGRNSIAESAQSMGGEDFAWYLQSVSGAMARLGVRVPGTEGGDLHQSNFDIDESALPIGVRLSAAILDEIWTSAAGPA